MPAYPWMHERKLDVSHTEGKIITLRKLGVPYPEGFESRAVDELRQQARSIAEGLSSSGIQGVDDSKEIIAVIAYLQRLGTDIKKLPTAQAE